VNRAPRGRALFALIAIVLSLGFGAIAWTATPSSSTSNGTKQAAAHTAAVSAPPIVPFIRTLTPHMKGCECPTVFQLQRALKTAGVRPKTQKATGYYGDLTKQQVAAFQRKHGIAVSGIYGSKTHHALAKYYDKAGRQRLIAVAHSRRIVAITTAITTVTRHAALVGGSTLAYSQSSSRAILPKYPGVPPATDCSGYVTWVYQSVGLPDPSALGFDPVGWTGTLAKHGVVVSATNARIGDLAFYGGGYPFGHVAVVVHVHPTEVSSHGEPGIHLLPITYRPLSQLRRYF
jgi:peptidoglycan hydrolase-like protein with peptidoglycan-binding domain